MREIRYERKFQCKNEKGYTALVGHIESIGDERLTKQILMWKNVGRYWRRPRSTYNEQIDRVLSGGDVKSLRNRRVYIDVEEIRQISKNSHLQYSVFYVMVIYSLTCKGSSVNIYIDM